MATHSYVGNGNFTSIVCEIFKGKKFVENAQFEARKCVFYQNNYSCICQSQFVSVLAKLSLF